MSINNKLAQQQKTGAGLAIKHSSLFYGSTDGGIMHVKTL